MDSSHSQRTLRTDYTGALPRLVHADPIPNDEQLGLLGGGARWNRRFVYHLFDARGSLLYVGVTDLPRRRFQQHRRKKSWWPDVALAYIYVVQGSTDSEAKASARALEMLAIHGGLPLKNLTGPAQLPAKRCG